VRTLKRVVSSQVEKSEWQSDKAIWEPIFSFLLSIHHPWTLEKLEVAKIRVRNNE